MLKPEDIINYCFDYKVENGKVIEKSTNARVKNEELILKIKTAILIFKEAYSSYNYDLKMYGKTKTKSKNRYIEITLEKFGVDGSVNNYGVNRLINNIVNSNGHYEEFLSGMDMNNTKFDILIGKKRDFTLAYLRLKFRSKDLDISDFKVSQDFSKKSEGLSKVIIDFKINKLIDIKKWDNMDINSKMDYLKQNMDKALSEDDEVAYNYWLSNLNFLESDLDIKKTL